MNDGTKATPGTESNEEAEQTSDPKNGAKKWVDQADDADAEDGSAERTQERQGESNVEVVKCGNVVDGSIEKFARASKRQ